MQVNRQLKIEIRESGLPFKQRKMEKKPRSPEGSDIFRRHTLSIEQTLQVNTCCCWCAMCLTNTHVLLDVRNHKEKLLCAYV